MAFDWTEKALEQLSALWAEGHTTSEIGRRMGISKNAVVGAARRAGLAKRADPIKRDQSQEIRTRNAEVLRLVGAGHRQMHVADAVGLSRPLVHQIVSNARDAGWVPQAAPGDVITTLPPLPSLAPAPTLVRPAAPRVAPIATRPAWVVRPDPVPVPAVRPVRSLPAAEVVPDRLAGVVFRSPAARPCAWPIGEPGTRTFRSCDDPTEPGRPYCPHHCDVAYVARRRPALEQGGAAHAD